MKAIQAKLEATNHDPYGMSELATYLYRHGKVDEARTLWDKAAASDANLPPADIEIVFELVDQGKASAAEAALNRARTRHSKSPHFWLADGQLAMSLGDRKRAETSFQSAVKAAPNLMVTNLTVGRYLEFTGDAKAAREHYKRATVSTKRPEGWILLATGSFQSGNYEAALQELREASKADSSQPAAESRLAELFLGASDFVGAHQWFTAALAQNPKDNQARVRLAQVNRLLGRKDEAKQQFERVLEDGPDLAALVGLAQIQEELGEPAEAERLYRGALAIDRENILASNNLAMLLFQQNGSAKDASALIKVAMQQMPDDPSVRSTYGCVLLMANDYVRAHEVLAQVVRQLPGDAWTRYAYGMALLNLKKPEQAREQFRGCLLLDPDFARKAQIDVLLGDQTGGAVN